MTPLIKKLGLKPGLRAYILNSPPGYAAVLGPLPGGVMVLDEPEESLDFIQYFAPTQQALAHQFPMLKPYLAATGMLWIAWPKKASRIPSDLTGNEVRRIGLHNGLVDVKVCAIDADWSGLKFVYRLKDRR